MCCVGQYDWGSPPTQDVVSSFSGAQRWGFCRPAFSPSRSKDYSTSITQGGESARGLTIDNVVGWAGDCMWDDAKRVNA